MSPTSPSFLIENHLQQHCQLSNTVISAPSGSAADPPASPRRRHLADPVPVLISAPVSVLGPVPIHNPSAVLVPIPISSPSLFSISSLSHPHSIPILIPIPTLSPLPYYPHIISILILCHSHSHPYPIPILYPSSLNAISVAIPIPISIPFLFPISFLSHPYPIPIPSPQSSGEPPQQKSPCHLRQLIPVKVKALISISLLITN